MKKYYKVVKLYLFLQICCYHLVGKLLLALFEFLMVRVELFSQNSQILFKLLDAFAFRLQRLRLGFV